jgi:hypothetical protein
MTTPDDDIRTMLEDAVSDVEPRHGLDQIRARTGNPAGTRRPWLWGAGGAMLATAATVAAFAVFGGPGTTDAGPGFAAGPDGTPAATAGTAPTDRASEPASSPTDGASSTAAAGTGDSTVPVYYVGDTSRGPRLFREFHSGPPGPGPLISAVQQAVEQAPDDADYRSPWPEGTTLAHAEQQDDLLIVDLHGDLHDRPAAMSAADAELAVQQLVYTAQAATQTTLPVQLVLDGRRSDTLLGVPTSEPLARAAADDVLAQVWIIDPAEGADVESGFTVNGLANAFEANVQWELMQGDTVVKRGFTNADECCTMAPFSFTVDAPPGDYTLVVHDSDPSDGEGLAPWQDTKDITVTG